MWPGVHGAALNGYLASCVTKSVLLQLCVPSVSVAQTIVMVRKLYFIDIISYILYGCLFKFWKKVYHFQIWSWS